MEGDNLSELAPDFQPFGGRLGSAKQSWVLVAAAIMLPGVYLRDLSMLAYLSAAGVFASLALTVLVGWEGAQLGESATAFVHVSILHSAVLSGQTQLDCTFYS
jgi:vesicular inhibitory amino acid transporter